MEIGKRFDDIVLYNENMRMSIQDKLYFIRYLPDNFVYTFVDFGCADGSLLNTLCGLLRLEKHSAMKYIGYDCSEEMISLAKSRFQGEISDDIVFTNSWGDIENELSKKRSEKEKVVLILSSVIHEVYSYAKKPQDLLDFWYNQVLRPGFDYIVIRDMIADEDYTSPAPKELVESVQWNSGLGLMFADFTKRWVPDISKISIKDILHYLLKYRWKVNWQRELNENYFPVTTKELLDIILDPCLNNKYKLEYWERFRVKFLDEKFLEDFGINLGDYGYNTHVKAIFKKR